MLSHPQGRKSYLFGFNIPARSLQVAGIVLDLNTVGKEAPGIGGLTFGNFPNGASINIHHATGLTSAFTVTDQNTTTIIPRNREVATGVNRGCVERVRFGTFTSFPLGASGGYSLYIDNFDNTQPFHVPVNYAAFQSDSNPADTIIIHCESLNTLVQPWVAWYDLEETVRI